MRAITKQVSFSHIFPHEKNFSNVLRKSRPHSVFSFSFIFRRFTGFIFLPIPLRSHSAALFFLLTGILFFRFFPPFSLFRLLFSSFSCNSALFYFLLGIFVNLILSQSFPFGSAKKPPSADDGLFTRSFYFFGFSAARQSQ